MRYLYNLIIFLVIAFSIDVDFKFSISFYRYLKDWVLTVANLISDIREDEETVIGFNTKRHKEESELKTSKEDEGDEEYEEE
jgi:hypothetical protein